MVQEIKVMRSSVTAREKERAERATLVQQEKLSKAKVLMILLSVHIQLRRATCKSRLRSQHLALQHASWHCCQ